MPAQNIEVITRLIAAAAGSPCFADSEFRTLAQLLSRLALERLAVRGGKSEALQMSTSRRVVSANSAANIVKAHSGASTAAGPARPRVSSQRLSSPSYYYKLIRVKRSDGRVTTVSLDPVLVTKACEVMGGWREVLALVRQAAVAYYDGHPDAKSCSGCVALRVMDALEGTGL
jgi:hypothetical protein